MTAKMAGVIAIARRVAADRPPDARNAYREAMSITPIARPPAQRERRRFAAAIRAMRATSIAMATALAANSHGVPVLIEEVR